MKNKKMVLWIALIVIAIIPIYAQQYDSEKDFKINRDANVKGGVIITEYIGTKKEVRIPPSIQNSPVTSIGDNAFFLTSLTSVTIPNSVTSIEQEAFSNCSSLTSVTIPNSVTNIGGGAFWGCTSLTSVTIPDNVTSIGEGAFSNCTGLTAINVDAGNTAYISDNGILYNINKTNLIQYPAGKAETTFSIPRSVTSIEMYAFRSCPSLTGVTIGNGVTSIGRGAFYSCKSLKNVTIPDSVTSIGDSAFYFCNRLTSVTIPNSVSSIGEYAFANSGLTSVIIPNGVTSIGNSAFSGCFSLTSVTFENGSNIQDTDFGKYAFPEGVYSEGGNSLKTAYSKGKAGTYTRQTNESTWTKK